MHHQSILSIVFHVFMLLYPAILYIDATIHKIGKIPNDKSFLNMAAGAWAAAATILGLLTLPFYLFGRGKLIEKAKTQPVYVGIGKRIFIVIILIAFNLGFAILVAKVSK